MLAFNSKHRTLYQELEWFGESVRALASGNTECNQGETVARGQGRVPHNPR
jgi:hypothetical protein